MTSRSRRRRAANLKFRYGLSLADYDALLIRQGGGCAICGTPSDLHVDHDHATGRVRGLLCRGCNIGVGHFADDSHRVAAASLYLSFHHPSHR